MVDRRMPCHQDCPDRTAECKRTCSRWAEWEDIKKEIYAARRRVLEGIPDSAKKKQNAKRIKLDKMKGRL